MSQDTKEILSIFEQINKVPRCSRDQERICQWVKQWAQKNNFKYNTDDVENVYVKIPASKGYENCPAIIIQSHMDMVCEKVPELEHDFSKDPIKFVYNGDWLSADKTSLGADNGIAMAYAMYMAVDKSLKHPPLELFFTVDEEIGLIGADKMNPDLLTGRILLNIDSEDEGIFTVGCAGGNDVEITLPLSFQPRPKNHKVYEFKADGMRGGH